jgi:ring-1,2-phenylacetyl-CoA epoxidase subunit PaaD
MVNAVETRTPPPSIEQIWDWLDQVDDPEIPVISVVDLGIVREVSWDDDVLRVVITPTYSGCPATRVIQQDIERALRDRGLDAVRLETRISPPWTTDWLSQRGRDRLLAYGIAPPTGSAIPVTDIGRGPRPVAEIECPHCGSTRTRKVSDFGSTPCKAHYTCRDCLEPFDYFKCI